MSTPIYKDFIDNKYYRTYIRLLSKPDITTEYTEEHHILPKSLGGLDSKENLVRITSRKHFIAHYLLTKFTKENTRSWRLMVFAFNMMSSHPQGNIRYINSRLYTTNKKNMSKSMSALQSGKGNSQFGTMWIYNLTLKESKKIKKDQLIPDGWVKGYINNWDSHYTQRKCKTCGKIGCMSLGSKYCSLACRYYIPEKIKPIKQPKIKPIKKCLLCGTPTKSKDAKYCSLECRYANKPKSKWELINNEEFVEKYIEIGSMYKTLQYFKIAPAGENTYAANDIILNSGNFEALCIYMKNKK